MIEAVFQVASSNIPGLENYIGSNLFNIIGPDTTIIGLFGLLVFLIFWAYMGAGFEAGIIIFAGLIGILSQTGYLPAWTGYIMAIALGFLAMKILSSTKW